MSYDEPEYPDDASCITCGKPLSPPRYGPMARECWDCRHGVTPANAAAAPQEGAGQ